MNKQPNQLNQLNQVNQHMIWVISYWNEMFHKYFNQYQKLDKKRKRYAHGAAILLSSCLGFYSIRYIHWKKIHSFLIYPFIAFPSELSYPLRII